MVERCSNFPCVRRDGPLGLIHVLACGCPCGAQVIREKHRLASECKRLQVRQCEQGSRHFFPCVRPHLADAASSTGVRPSLS